ncbi:MAG: SDR family oxidoreductase [Actinomycetota bacterium]|nr:SDR family oxidoreductase [Actinomycetota bacterium]
MANRRIFLTGYPGFIGRWQVRSILAADPDVELTFLVQEKFMDRALEDIAAMYEEGKVSCGNLRAVAGDVTSPVLGLYTQEYESIATWATEVWHLAGAFDLNVTEGLARKVNYWGTRHVVNFCNACTNLSFLVHFSSVVVHAERESLITEDELDAGQELNNNYFMTKFWGEMEVRRAMEQGLPAIIIRPAGVLGDSRTGETDKFDNIYILFRVIRVLEMLKIPPMYLGTAKVRPNFIPVDFMVDSVTAITGKPGAVGKCFHVVDPDPPLFSEIIDEIWGIIGGKHPKITIPTRVTDFLAIQMPWIFRIMGVPPDSMTYLNHVGIFDDSNTREMLEGSGITCPRIQDYYPTLYAWWLENRKREGMQQKM